MQRSAILSDCGLFRYELRRVWDDTLPPFVVGALNPSTADHEKDDPTSRRVDAFARREGCGSAILWNVGAYRATSPKDWAAAPDPIGPDNFEHVRRILVECLDRRGKALAAWGSGAPQRYTIDYELLAQDIGVRFWCLGLTKSRAPRHPLYVHSAEPLKLYRWQVIR